MSAVFASDMPRGWELRKLGDCMRLINGRAYSQHELLDEGTPIIRIQNLNGGDRWYYSNLVLPEDKYCSRGDLLFAWSASFGPYIWSGDRSIYHYHIWRIVPLDDIDKKFAFHLLEWITERVKAASHGVAMLHMTKAGMEAWEIPLPPLEEQHRIAAILDQAETLRTQRRQALAHLDTLAQSLFLDMFGDPVANPKGWTVCRLEKIASKITDGTHKTPAYTDRGVEFLSAKDIKDRRIVWGTGKFISELEHEQLVKRCAPELGDLLLAKSGSLGSVAIIDRVHQFSLFESLCLIKHARDLVDGIFLASMLQSNSMQSYLLGRNKGVAIKHLHLVDIRSLEVVLPPLPLQQTFATRIQAIEALKSTYRSALAQLDALFASLQQRAFSGELTRPASAAVSMHTKPDLSAICTLDVKKMLETMIYVAKRMPGHDFYKSLKALYAGDRQHLEHHGSLIYGETYEALEHGPVPKAAYALTKRLEEAASSNLFADDPMSIPLRRIGNQLIPARDADFGLLSAAERQSLDWAIKYYGPMNFGDTKTVSHDSAYLATAPNAPILIEAIIRTLPEAAQRRFFG